KTGGVEKYRSFGGKVKNAAGVHDLYICFDKASGDVRLDWWQFKK
ncbi:MAG: carbohydrate-binding protein, partial [Prevotella sp.]|nr:carbohydrate-binding protein [Prevotella sp.]